MEKMMCVWVCTAGAAGGVQVNIVKIQSVENNVQHWDAAGKD